jgi:3-hydroxy-9,10-secoandrosta-1,3,5(10)-triene-9,17-dione monooxygenase
MDRDEYLGRVRALVPAIRERAARTEELRRLPDETFKEFQEAGLFRALQPERWGGYEIDPLVFYEAIMEVAAVCPSSGWVLGVLGVHDWQLALFPERAQAEVWSDDSSVQISSSYAPTGSVEPVDGGFRVRGRWSFSSGCDHCDWVFLGGIAGLRDGRPDMRTFLVPRSAYAIDDVWHVSGLAGTGSKDIVVEDAFVPEHRTHAFADAFQFKSPGQAVNPGPLFRLPFGCVFTWGISAPAIGAATGALETYRTQTRERLAGYDFSKLAEDPFAQLRLAEATSDIDAARARLQHDLGQMLHLARTGEEIPLELRVRSRWDAADAVARSVRAVDRLFEASGGRAIFLHNPIQRAFRDVHAMRAHAANNPDRSARTFGRFELVPGQPPADPFL